MPRYIPIKGDDLSIVEHEIKTKKVVTKKGQTNHIWIYDRSGSMSSYLPDLTNQLVKLSRTIPKNDYLTIGWFSSEGNQFNWIFKGFRIVDGADYKTLETAIKKASSSLGCTCFSEILNDTDQVIKDLSAISKTFSLHFFTDGYPVVNNYQKELSSIFTAINKIKGKIQTAMFVGYGYGYNKELLASMSEKMGALLIHSSMISEYENSVSRLITLSENSEPKEEVEPIVSKPLAVYTITDQGVVLYSPEEDGKLYIAPTKGNSTKVYYISNEKPDKKSWTKVESSGVNFGDETDDLSKAMYAAALVLSQQAKADVALEILGKIGDKKFISKLDSAFQVEEFGSVESEIGEAIQDVSQRFTAGRDTNYLPPADAFCVFDVLDALVNDDEAAFFPYNEKFHYERIGVASTSKDDYPKFEADKTAKCPFTDLTWHDSRLNLSVKVNIPGTVELKDRDGVSARSLGIRQPYQTYVWRNYSFIKDGHVNVKTFYLTSSEASYKEFKNKGIVVDDTFKSNKVYGLDISKLPAINRKIAEGKTSATELCEAVLQEHKLKAKIKALKALRKQEVHDYEYEPAFTLTGAQDAFLKANGLDAGKGGAFSPPTVKEEPVDFYMAKYFDIALSGIATLPTLAKVQDKIASGKARTPVEALLEEGIKVWSNRKAKLTDSDAKKAWFDGTIKDLQTQMKALRSIIQKNKFAVILGHKWYQEFSGSRENCSVEIDGVKCVFKLGEEKVAY